MEGDGKGIAKKRKIVTCEETPPKVFPAEEGRERERERASLSRVRMRFR